MGSSPKLPSFYTFTFLL